MDDKAATVERAPRRRCKEARPTELIEAGLQEFAQHGFAATRLEDVARRARVANGTIYLYPEYTGRPRAKCVSRTKSTRKAVSRTMSTKAHASRARRRLGAHLIGVRRQCRRSA